MYFGVEIDSLTYHFPKPESILLTSNLGGKTPGFVKAAYPKSSVQSQEEGHHTKLLGLESQQTDDDCTDDCYMLIDDKRVGFFFGKKVIQINVASQSMTLMIHLYNVGCFVLFGSDVECSKTPYMRRLI